MQMFSKVSALGLAALLAVSLTPRHEARGESVQTVALQRLATEEPITEKVDRSIRGGLGLRHYVVRSVKVVKDMRVDGRVSIDVDLGKGPTRLVLDPYSLRAQGFEVIVHGGAQEPLSIIPPSLTTYRGLDQTTGAAIAASIVDGQLSAAIRPVDGEAVFIQPLTDVVPGASHEDHVIYLDSDIRGTSWRCATDALACPDCGTNVSNRGPGGTCTRTVEMVFDTDFPYYQGRGSSVTTATSDIENIVNQCDLIYRRDVSITFGIRQIVVRTTAATDPYNSFALTSVDPGTLLSSIGTVWSGVSAPTRDLVHLMTGRDLTSSTIGIAWVGVVCRSSSNTGLSQTLFSSNLAQRTTLTAHEIGHNFGSSHDAASGFIMAPSVSGSGQVAFSPASITTINNYILSNSGCLAAAGPVAMSDSATTQAPSVVLIDVLANDAATCAQSFAISLPSATSSLGGALAISVGTGPSGRNQIRYTPPASVPTGGLNDSFSYRLTESPSGQFVVGAVSVRVNAASVVPCPGDFNASGTKSVQDLFDYLAAYFAGTVGADINSSGTISVQDLFDFIALYFAPCP